MNNDQKTKNNVLVEKADAYAHHIYRLSRKLPDDERYGVTSQLRRAALSVPLNIVEGFARKTSRYFRHFLKIAYGSLKESQYLLQFAVEEQYLDQSDIIEVHAIGDEIGAMVWKSLQTLEQSS